MSSSCYNFYYCDPVCNQKDDDGFIGNFEIKDTSLVPVGVYSIYNIDSTKLILLEEASGGCYNHDLNEGTDFAFYYNSCEEVGPPTDPSCSNYGGGGDTYGCTDENATNYDPSATQDNGTCEGCTDSNAANYCALCTIDDGTCWEETPTHTLSGTATHTESETATHTQSETCTPQCVQKDYCPGHGSSFAAQDSIDDNGTFTSEEGGQTCENIDFTKVYRDDKGCYSWTSFSDCNKNPDAFITVSSVEYDNCDVDACKTPTHTESETETLSETPSDSQTETETPICICARNCINDTIVDCGFTTTLKTNTTYYSDPSSSTGSPNPDGTNEPWCFYTEDSTGCTSDLDLNGDDTPIGCDDPILCDYKCVTLRYCGSEAGDFIADPDGDTVFKTRLSPGTYKDSGGTRCIIVELDSSSGDCPKKLDSTGWTSADCNESPCVTPTDTPTQSESESPSDTPSASDTDSPSETNTQTETCKPGVTVACGDSTEKEYKGCINGFDVGDIVAARDSDDTYFMGCYEIRSTSLIPDEDWKYFNEGTVKVDDCNDDRCGTPTATASTPSPSDSNTPSESQTETFTLSYTPTETLTPSASDSKTPSASDTDTPSESDTHSETISETPTQSETLTPKCIKVTNCVSGFVDGKFKKDDLNPEKGGIWRDSSDPSKCTLVEEIKCESDITLYWNKGDLEHSADAFSCDACDTPTSTTSPTTSGSSTETPSGTPTESQSTTQSESETFTGTRTPTATHTLTDSETSSFTVSETLTETLTDSETSSFTESETLTHTVSESETSSFTVSETLTQTESESETSSFTESETLTHTVSESETSSFTVSETLTHTVSESETFTGTPTDSDTRTPSGTTTFTRSTTPSGTTTGTTTSSPSGTTTGTRSTTPSNTTTGTRSTTPSNTTTGTVTGTNTNTTTGTHTQSNTKTPPTPTDSETTTHSTSGTETHTASPSNTDTETETKKQCGSNGCYIPQDEKGVIAKEAKLDMSDAGYWDARNKFYGLSLSLDQTGRIDVNVKRLNWNQDDCCEKYENLEDGCASIGVSVDSPYWLPSYNGELACDLEKALTAESYRQIDGSCETIPSWKDAVDENGQKWINHEAYEPCVTESDDVIEEDVSIASRQAFDDEFCVARGNVTTGDDCHNSYYDPGADKACGILFNTMLVTWKVPTQTANLFEAGYQLCDRGVANYGKLIEDVSPKDCQNVRRLGSNCSTLEDVYISKEADMVIKGTKSYPLPDNFANISHKVNFYLNLTSKSLIAQWSFSGANAILLSNESVYVGDWEDGKSASFNLNMQYCDPQTYANLLGQGQCSMANMLWTANFDGCKVVMTSSFQLPGQSTQINDLNHITDINSFISSHNGNYPGSGPDGGNIDTIPTGSWPANSNAVLPGGSSNSLDNTVQIENMIDIINEEISRQNYNQFNETPKAPIAEDIPFLNAIPNYDYNKLATTGDLHRLSYRRSDCQNILRKVAQAISDLINSGKYDDKTLNTEIELEFENSDFESRYPQFKGLCRAVSWPTSGLDNDATDIDWGTGIAINDDD